MKLKTLRGLMMLVLLLEAGLLIYRWYVGNGGWSSRGNWVIAPVIALAFLWKALDHRHRCPGCGKKLDWNRSYKKNPNCPRCGQILE